MPPNPGNFLYNETERRIGNSAKNAYDETRPKNEPRYLMKIREIEKQVGFVTPLKWANIIFYCSSHLVILTWLGYNLFAGLYPKWQTVLFGLLYVYSGLFGVTAGVHRYWSHQSYKATTPFRWLLGILCSVAGQNKLYDWIRDHRVHHKFSETSADPHDASRGFFFSHMGWLMMKKHPDVIREGRKVDLSDIDRDPIVQFNSKYFLELYLLLCVAVPILVPVLAWDETWGQAALVHRFFMHMGLHSVWCVNSFAHACGNRPYNPKLKPAENWLVSLMIIGEGWHNYHHTFPWDYKSAELPYFLNITTLLLDCAAGLGLVSHRKTASPEIIQATIRRTHNS